MHPPDAPTVTVPTPVRSVDCVTREGRTGYTPAMSRAPRVATVALAFACTGGATAPPTPLVAVAAADVRVALEGDAIAMRVPFTVTNRGADAIQLEGCGAVLEQSVAGTWRAAVTPPCSASQVQPVVAIPAGASRTDAVRFAGDLTGTAPPFWEGTLPPAGRYRIRLPLRLGAAPFGDAAVSNPFDVTTR
jgi:hypothetical protein